MIETNWLDKDNGIRYWEFGANWTWEEFYDHLQNDFQDSPVDSKPLDVILDFSKTRQLPPHFLTQMRVSSKRVNENLDTIVFLGNPVVRALMESFHILNSDFTNRYGFADNIEQALQVVYRQQQRTLS